MRRQCVSLAFVAAIFVLGNVPALAQGNDADEGQAVSLTFSETGRAAAAEATNLRLHGMARKGAKPASLELTTSRSAAAHPASGLNPVPPPGFYPADVKSLYYGQPQVQTAATHSIYVNGRPQDWGYPGHTLWDFERSKMIHVLDQYTAATKDNRYYPGAYAIANYPILSTLGENDLLQILHSAAAKMGSGYGHIFNVFLPRGVDFCVESSCYSPDNPSTFSFCAFHGSVDLPHVGHVLFTLEPYQAVEGCQVLTASESDALANSTLNALVHETADTITNPDGVAWQAIYAAVVQGDEIGDLCVSYDLTQPYYENPLTNLHGTKYSVQMLYSNKYHACANVP